MSNLNYLKSWGQLFIYYFEVEVSCRYLLSTSNMGHLFVVRGFVVVSHLKIFPLELLGPAIGFSASPSSCKGKILRWDTTTNSPTTNKCLTLDVGIYKIWQNSNLPATIIICKGFFHKSMQVYLNLLNPDFQRIIY